MASAEGSSAGAGASTDAAAGAGASGVAPAAPAGPVYSKAGLVLVAGSMSHGLTGRSGPTTHHDGVADNKLWTFHVMMPMRDVRISKAVTGPTAVHYVLLSDTGDAYIFGRNERGQLGLGHMRNVYTPTKIPGLPPIVDGACGRNHTMLLGSDGSVWAAGDSTKGQCGLGERPDPITTFNRVLAPGMVKVAAGADFSMALDREGNIYSCGTEEYGVCGTGETGESIVQAGRIAFGVVPRFSPIRIPGHRFVDIACGALHTLALDDKGAVFACGHGGYGRCVTPLTLTRRSSAASSRCVHRLRRSACRLS